MSVTEDIKARIDILDLMQSYNVQVRKAGRNYKAPCPFHSERTPSFVVFPESGTWRCFGACGEGGDIFAFVMKQENVDFGGALELLAGRAGIELRPQTPEQKGREAELDKLRGLLTETAAFFHDQLQFAPAADYARSYVAERGLTEATLDRFQIGYAPDDWRQGLTHLQTLGYAEKEIIDAGVATRNDKGNVYDRFRNRLVIPIRDGHGQVIGFGARALAKEDNPKYLNSPQTPLFDKGHTLFALDAARRAIRETETAVIVEGYMDALQAHQAGFSNVVAQMGTALTEPQLKQLARYAKRLVLALDPDAAGVNATLRGLSVARQTLGDYRPVFDGNAVLRQSSNLDIDLRVMTLPDGQDPDDLIRETPDRWPELVAAAQSIMEYVIEAGTAQVTPQTSLADREQIARDLLPALLENEPHRHAGVQKLAFKLRINERDLMALAQRQQESVAPALPVTPVRKTTTRETSPAPLSPNAPAKPIRAESALEAYCLSALILHPDLWPVVNRQFAQIASQATNRSGSVERARPGEIRDLLLGPLSEKDFTRADYQAILQALKAATAQDAVEPIQHLRRTLPAELSEEIERLMTDPQDPMQQTDTWQAREAESVLKEKARLLAWSAPIEDELIKTALHLRSRRLKRETEEMYFLQAEGNDEPELVQRNHQYLLARHEIERAIRQVQHAQHSA